MKKITIILLTSILMIPSLAFASNESTSTNIPLADVNIQASEEVKVIEKKSNIAEVVQKALDTNNAINLNEKKVDKETIITSISSDGGVQGKKDYVYGRFWRIKSNIVVNGQLKTANGILAKNAPVKVELWRTINNTKYSGEGHTDSEGNFSIPINNIGPAAGEYSYYNISSTHYYDIIPFRILSGNIEVISSDNLLYHFAYSMYNPH